jgi:hypothetical protein
MICNQRQKRVDVLRKRKEEQEDKLIDELLDDFDGIVDNEYNKMNNNSDEQLDTLTKLALVQSKQEQEINGSEDDETDETAGTNTVCEADVDTNQKQETEADNSSLVNLDVPIEGDDVETNQKQETETDNSSLVNLDAPIEGDDVETDQKQAEDANLNAPIESDDANTNQKPAEDAPIESEADKEIDGSEDDETDDSDETLDTYTICETDMSDVDSDQEQVAEDVTLDAPIENDASEHTTMFEIDDADKETDLINFVNPVSDDELSENNSISTDDLADSSDEEKDE